MDQAIAQYESIKDIVQRYEKACDDQNYKLQDSIREEIEAMPLEVTVRYLGWTQPGSDSDPDEYRILLSWGGPAVQITGELSQLEPVTARIEAQDWGTEWTPYTEADELILLEFARCFWFGA